jgi:alkylhydroperoxidase/carboxymuconolactone decarboxylase family protein YurZ
LPLLPDDSRLAAAQYLDNDCALVEQIKRNYQVAAISEKLKALLAIAGKVQQGGKYVTDEDIDRARNTGATDLEIHDTVLIAAAFCMYNRYVDGLATWTPDDESIYRQMADRVVKVGYTQPGWEKPFPLPDRGR